MLVDDSIAFLDIAVLFAKEADKLRSDHKAVYNDLFRICSANSGFAKLAYFHFRSFCNDFFLSAIMNILEKI